MAAYQLRELLNAWAEAVRDTAHPQPPHYTGPDIAFEKFTEKTSEVEPGAAFVDISIDQGGCAETSRPTNHLAPIYVEEEVVHYCVTNMPAIVPNTSTYALNNSTLSYGLEIANRGFPQALVRNKALAKGLNTFGGKVTHDGVAAAFTLPHAPLEEVLRA